MASQPVYDTMASAGPQFTNDWSDLEAFFNFQAYDMNGSQDSQTDSLGCLDSPDIGFDESLDTLPIEDLNHTFPSTQVSQTSLGYRIADESIYQDVAFDRFSPMDAPNGWYLPDSAAAIRDLVHSSAATDSRSGSVKEKRRDAGIALHLQRLEEAYVRDAGSYSDLDTLSPQLSQDSLPELSRTASTYSPSTTASSKDETPQPTSRGVQMVLDLNMNVTTCLPKKQKQRTKAQIEDYINVRRNGACEKHRKQHKKCNCLDKLALGSTPDGKVQKIVGISRKAHSQPLYYTQERTPASPIDERHDTGLQTATAPKTLRQAAQRYTCLMPNCTYQSPAVRSLQQHYAGHLTKARPAASTPVAIKSAASQPVLPILSQSSAQLHQPLATWYHQDTRSPVSVPENTSGGARGRFTNRSLEGPLDIPARPVSVVSAYGTAGTARTLAVQNTRTWPQSLERQWRGRLQRTGTTSSPATLGETVLRSQQGSTKAVSVQAAGLLSLLGGVVAHSISQLLLGVTIWLQSSSSMISRLLPEFRALMRVGLK